MRLSFKMLINVPLFRTSTTIPIDSVKMMKPTRINVIVKIRPFGVMGATSVKPTVVKVIPAW